MFTWLYCLLDFLCCSVNGSVCPVCFVFVNYLVKQFAIFVGVVVILLLNVMEVLSVGGVALLDRPCMVFQRMCVWCLRSQCVSMCSLHRFCLCFCMSEVISSFKSLRAGSQVFAHLMLFLCVILQTMWSDKSLQLLCILPFGMLCLSAVSMMFVNIMFAVCMHWVWWSE